MSQASENSNLGIIRLAGLLAFTANQIRTATPEQDIQNELRSFFEKFAKVQSILDRMLQEVATSLPEINDPDVFSVTPEVVIARAAKARMHSYLHDGTITLASQLNGPMRQFDGGQPHQLLEAIAWLNSLSDVEA